MTRKEKEEAHLLASYKEMQIKVARQLCYPENTITRIKLARTEMEVDRALITARKQLFDW